MVGGSQPISQKLLNEIIFFILDNDRNGCFKSALHFYNNFINLLSRLLSKQQIAVFRNGKEMTGVCGWVLIHDEKDYNKLRWIYPDDITTGDILVIPFAVLNKGTNIFKIKKLLEDLGLRDKIKKVHWNNWKRKSTFTKGVVHV